MKFLRVIGTALLVPTLLFSILLFTALIVYLFAWTGLSSLI